MEDFLNDEEVDGDEIDEDEDFLDGEEGDLDGEDLVGLVVDFVKVGIEETFLFDEVGRDTKVDVDRLGDLVSGADLGTDCDLDDLNSEVDLVTIRI
jgi:hypothetical protein